MKWIAKNRWDGLLAGAIALLVGMLAGRSVAEERPNILMIVADDFGAWAMQCADNPNAFTPNLDRMREQGVMLTRFYAPSPACSPSRASLLTSRYGLEIGVNDAINGREHVTVGISPDLPTWPRLLQDAGYHTALFGKYHCGSCPESHPTNIGYGLFTGFINGARVSKNPMVEICCKNCCVNGFTSDIITDFTIDYIRKHQQQCTGPFAVSLHFWAPHANVGCRAPDLGRTWRPLSAVDLRPHLDSKLELPGIEVAGLDRARLERMYREYMASVTSVDRNIGRVLDLLDEMQLSERTLVIFTADHGMNMGHHGVWHKGNGEWLVKGRTDKRSNMWDSSLRVPALVRWPGVVEAGTTIQQTLSHLDWFPTLVEIGQAKLPQSSIIRGRNFLPLLRGNEETAKSWDNELYAEYTVQRDRGGGMADMRCLQSPEWKLVRFVNKTRKDEFYNRVADRQEANNLIDSTNESVRSAIQEMNQRLDNRLRTIYGRQDH